MKKKYIIMALPVIIIILIVIICLLCIHKPMTGFTQNTTGLYKLSEKTDSGEAYMSDEWKLCIKDGNDDYKFPLPPINTTIYFFDMYSYFYNNGYIYYSLHDKHNGDYFFYRFHIETRHTEEIGEMNVNHSQEESLELYTANEYYILILINNVFYRMDIETGLIEKYTEIPEQINQVGVMGKYIVYSDKNRHICIYDMENKHEKVLEDTSSILFALYNNDIYIADDRNEGKLSIIHMDSDEIEQKDTKMVIGFGMTKDGVEVRYNE